jgi:Mg2+/citrate symporter
VAVVVAAGIDTGMMVGTGMDMDCDKSTDTAVVAAAMEPHFESVDFFVGCHFQRHHY